MRRYEAEQARHVRRNAHQPSSLPSGYSAHVERQSKAAIVSSNVAEKRGAVIASSSSSNQSGQKGTTEKNPRPVTPTSAALVVSESLAQHLKSEPTKALVERAGPENTFEHALVSKVAVLESLVLVQHQQLRMHTKLVHELKDKLLIRSKTVGFRPSPNNRSDYRLSSSPTAPTSYGSLLAPSDKAMANPALSAEAAKERELRVKAVIGRLYSSPTKQRNDQSRSHSSVVSTATNSSNSKTGNQTERSNNVRRVREPSYLQPTKAMNSRLSKAPPLLAAIELGASQVTEHTLPTKKTISHAPKITTINNQTHGSNMRNGVDGSVKVDKTLPEHKEKDLAHMQRTIRTETSPVLPEVKPTLQSSPLKSKDDTKAVPVGKLNDIRAVKPAEENMLNKSIEKSLLQEQSDKKPMDIPTNVVSTSEPINAITIQLKNDTTNTPAFSGLTSEVSPPSKPQPMPTTSPQVEKKENLTASNIEELGIVSEPSLNTGGSSSVKVGVAILISVRNLSPVSLSAASHNGVQDGVPDPVLFLWTLPVSLGSFDRQLSFHNQLPSQAEFLGKTERHQSSFNPDFSTPIMIPESSLDGTKCLRVEVLGSHETELLAWADVPAQQCKYLMEASNTNISSMSTLSTSASSKAPLLIPLINRNRTASDGNDPVLVLWPRGSRSQQAIHDIEAKVKSMHTHKAAAILPRSSLSSQVSATNTASTVAPQRHSITSPQPQTTSSTTPLLSTSSMSPSDNKSVLSTTQSPYTSKEQVTTITTNVQAQSSISQSPEGVLASKLPTNRSPSVSSPRKSSSFDDLMDLDLDTDSPFMDSTPAKPSINTTMNPSTEPVPSISSGVHQTTNSTTTTDLASKESEKPKSPKDLDDDYEFDFDM